MEYLLIPVFAILNRARGSTLFGLTTSTSEARIVATMFMGLSAAMLRQGDTYPMLIIMGWTWAMLMLWCVWSWDYLWSAAIGSPGPSTGFPPVDWIMSILWGVPPVAVSGQINMTSRIWGLIGMGLRMTLAAPCIVGLAYIGGHPENAWIASLTVLLGVPYFVWGLVFTYWPKFNAYTIMMSELTVGSALGAMVIFALS